MRVPAGQQRHGDIKCGQQAGGRALRGHVPYIVNNFYCFQGRPPLSAPGDSMPAMVCALIDELPVCRPNEPFVKCLCVKQMFSWGSPAHTTHYTPHTRHSRPGTIQQINGEMCETYHQITICMTILTDYKCITMNV